MSFENLARDRYSCRTFKADPVDPNLIDKVLEIALLAPTAANRWPLEIVVIESKEAIESIKETTPYHFDAPLFMVVCYDKEKVWRRRFDDAHSGIDDAAIVGSHVMFAIEEVGLGTTWVKSFDPKALRHALSLADRLEPVCLFPIGYKADDAKPAKLHTIRPRMEDVVTRL